MSWDKLFGSDRYYTLEERFFNAVYFMSAAISLLAFINNLLQKFGPEAYLFSLGLTLSYSAFYLLAKVKLLYRQLRWPFFCVLLVTLVYVWFISAGSHGPVFIIWVTYLVVIVVVIRKIERVIMLLVLFLCAIAIIFIDLQYPDFVRQYNSYRLQSYDIFIMSFLMGSALVLFMIIILNDYRRNLQKLLKLNDEQAQFNIDIISAQEELKKRNEELREANASKNKFISIMAHDIKNPLSAIIGLSDLMLSYQDKLVKEQRDKYIEQINLGSKEVYNLLENLLFWSRSQTETLKIRPIKFYLSDIIEPSLSLFETLIQEKKITIHNSISRSIVVFADYSMINTICRNLINNAIKYSPEGKNIFLEAQQEDNRVKVLIKDEGVGISEENQKKLFQIDQTISTRGTKGEKGTGLGLILCKEFIDRNQGEIGVISEEAKGATFWFRLPSERFE